MKEINSAGNKAAIKAASLKHKKYRDMHNLYIIEGRRAVLDSICQNAKIESVFLQKGYDCPLPDLPQYIEVYVVCADIMQKICQTKTPQGIAATVKIPFAAKPENIKRCLVLDKISDPGNMGTIIRSAAACGVYDIFLRDCCDPYNGKCVRATMGGINFVRFYYGNAKFICNSLKENNLIILCADMGGENIFKTALPRDNFALVIGGEAEGIGGEFLKLGDFTVSLPMKNIESLNAAISASVILYYILNK